MINLMKMIAPFVFWAAVMASPVLGGLYGFHTWSCSSKAVSFEDNRFGVLTGCMVKHKGKWLPLDNIRGFD